MTASQEILSTLSEVKFSGLTGSWTCPVRDNHCPTKKREGGTHGDWHYILRIYSRK